MVYVNNKKKLILAISAFVIVAVGFGVFQLVNSFKRDQKEVEKNMTIVNENYEKFNQYIEQFNQKSEILQKEMKEELYYTTLTTKNVSIVKLLNEIDMIVNNIMQINNILKDKCQVYYKNAEVNQKCQSYNVSMENVELVYKGAVENYNKVITSYNEWTNKTGNTSYKKLPLYQPKSINI